MGAHIPDIEAMESATAEALLSSLKTIEAAERRKHATVLNYWLSIRGDRAFPPIRDLDPIEISDAGPQSLLLEMIGGEDADIRHLGSTIRPSSKVEKISDAPAKSLLSCIAGKLPIVAATKDAFAFEEQYEGDDGPAHCWVTLLPFSAGGTLIDFVYGFVSLDGPPATGEEVEDSAEPKAAAPEIEPQAEEIEPEAEAATEPEAAEVEEEAEPVLEETAEEHAEESELVLDQAEPTAEEPGAADDDSRPGFSGRFSEKLKSVTGFYGRIADLDMGPWKVEKDGPQEIGEEPEQSAEEPEAAEAIEEPVAADEIEAVEEFEPVEEVVDEAAPVEEELLELEAVDEAEPAEEEPLELEAADQIAPAEEIEAIEEAEQPAVSALSTGEGTLQSKLTEVRAKADEARQAKLRANAALYEGLSAAYDFALDAEGAPEEYLKLVEGQGLKIQLRSPMKPVVKLAFDGLCDDSTIGQLETVLAWALKQDLPRGSLAEHIQSEGGIAAILGKSNGKAN